MEEINVDLTEMCMALGLGPVLIPEKLRARHLKKLCNQFSGNAFLIEDESTRQIAVDLRQSQGKCGGTK